MNAIDIKAAFTGNETNFTCLLLRLIAKSDVSNRKKLSREFPVEVKAVDIYKNACPYTSVACTEVDWEEISRRANEIE